VAVNENQSEKSNVSEVIDEIQNEQEKEKSSTYNSDMAIDESIISNARKL